jgi:hypothetical protein
MKLFKGRLTECEHGNLILTDIEPVRDSDVAYSAPDADRILGSSTIHWSRAYVDNWDANFGEKTDVVN